MIFVASFAVSILALWGLIYIITQIDRDDVTFLRLIGLWALCMIPVLNISLVVMSIVYGLVDWADNYSKGSNPVVFKGKRND